MRPPQTPDRGRERRRDPGAPGADLGLRQDRRRRLRQRAWPALGVEILSTGGTAAALREAGLEVTDVSEFTGQEEILDGRVKTLHPRLHAALLARRDDPEHMATLEREGIEPIDLVCVNLYPFEQTVAGHEVAPEVAIENIDIGGPTMIRAAAKNHEGVAVSSSRSPTTRSAPSWRSPAARSPPRPGTGSPTRPSPRPPATTPRSAAGSRPSTRTSPNTSRSPTRRCSTSPTARTRTSARRSTPKPASAATSSRGSRSCTAGRSPSTTCSTSTRPGAWSRTSTQPACVIVKHNNPCGVAIGEDALEAYEKALACDPMSAFGGVIASTGRSAWSWPRRCTRTSSRC